VGSTQGAAKSGEEIIGGGNLCKKAGNQKRRPHTLKKNISIYKYRRNLEWTHQGLFVRSAKEIVFVPYTAITNTKKQKINRHGEQKSLLETGWKKRSVIPGCGCRQGSGGQKMGNKRGE